MIAGWLLIVTALAVRLYLSSRFLLIPDEANYWQWSRHLALGYHDHPPMIAWTIRLATKLFGQNEFGVRLPTVLGLAVTSIYLFRFAGRWFSCRCGFHTTLLVQGLLLFNGAALIATPDGLLLPCWAGACYHAAMALNDRSPGQWLTCGLWFGLGLLSKYTMLLFLPSLFFCMSATPCYRRQLATVWPWLGLLVGLACFTPVLIWNADNGWATFRHVLYQGGMDKSRLLTLRYIGDFLGTQAMLLSPFIFIMLLMAWSGGGAARRRKAANFTYLHWMSATTFIVFLLLSLHVRVYGNWAAPAYVTAVILLAALYSPGRVAPRSRSSWFWNFSVFFAYVCTIPLLVQLVYPVLPLPLKFDRIARETTGWKQLGKQVEQVLQSMPRPKETFIFGLRYQQASELAFYMPGQPETVSINKWARPNVYDYWFNDAMLRGKDAVGIYEWQGMAPRLARLFTRVDPPREIHTFRVSPWFGRQIVHTLYVIRCYGFKGGLRWQPQEKNDIRVTPEVTDKSLPL